MSQHNSYFPPTKPLQSKWYANMAKQFPDLATTLEFSAPDAAAWVADCLYAAYLLGPLTTPFDNFGVALTGYVNTLIAGGVSTTVNPPDVPAYDPAAPAAVPPGIDGRRQKAADKIKAARAYTPLVIGVLLGTEGSGSSFNPATVAGLIRSIHLDPQGRAVVVFSKSGGHLDAVNLYMQRGTLAEGKVGTFTHTPALDPTPPLVPGTPEERFYTVQPVINDVEVGVRSAPMSLLMK